MMGLWSYWRRCRELERERDRAYRVWRRASYAYRDIVSIYALEPGAWGAGTPTELGSPRRTHVRRSPRPGGSWKDSSIPS